MQTRNYSLGESLPPTLRTGYESALNCDQRWIWVAEDAGHPCAILVAAPAHTVVILVRLVSVPGAPPEAITALLERASLDCIARGFSGYIIWLNPVRPTENRLMKVILGTGGLQIVEPQVACVGRTDGGSLRDIDMAAVVAGLEAQEAELRCHS